MLLVRAAIHPDQRVLEEDLAADGAIEEGPPRPDGSRPVRVSATHGAISVGYEGPSGGRPAARVEVPARLVAGYAVGLEPPDFDALLEAHDGERWRLVDVTGLAPVETVVRIAAGRDAADVAWATSSGGLRMEDVSVGARLAGVA